MEPIEIVAVFFVVFTVVMLSTLAWLHWSLGRQAPPNPSAGGAPPPPPEP